MNEKEAILQDYRDSVWYGTRDPEVIQGAREIEAFFESYQSIGWEFDISHPDKPGWYATLHCWDPTEGIFDRATEWLGKNWASDLPFTAWAGPFPDELTAQDWAKKNNPDG